MDSISLRMESLQVKLPSRCERARKRRAREADGGGRKDFEERSSSTSLCSLLSPFLLSIPPLKVPLEVLERMIRYTFLRLTKFTPSSDPYPLQNTTHLLLVSKAFRELCLPFFFYSVTIARPSDYITFFDPESGIFVVGEEGRKRWSIVKALGFGYNVEPPSRFPTQEEDQSSWIVPLVAPDPAELRDVCFFNQTVCLPGHHGPELHAVGEALADQGIRARFLEDISMGYEHSASLLEEDVPELEEWAAIVYDQSLEDEIADRIIQESTDAILISRSDFYGHLVSPNPTRTIPLVLRLSDPIVHLSLLTSIGSGASESLRATLFVYRNGTSSPSPDSPDAHVVTEYFALIRRLLEIYKIELFGYSTTHRPFFLDQFYEPDEEDPDTYGYALGSGQSPSELMLLPEVVSFFSFISFPYFDHSELIRHFLPRLQLYQRRLISGRCLPVSEAIELELRGKTPVVVDST